MAAAQIDFLLTPMVDANGSPGSGWTVEFYDAGTSTPQDVFAEDSLSTNLGDTITLDSRGTALAFGTGLTKLKIIIKDASASPVTIATYDGLSYASAITTSGTFYELDGSSPLAGDMDAAGYDINNLGDLNLGASKHVNIDHGHSYTPVGGDQLIYGDGSSVHRQFSSSGFSEHYDNATQVFNWNASGINLKKTLDMGSQKITGLADGTLATDAVSKLQMETADGVVTTAFGVADAAVTLASEITARYSLDLTSVFAATAATGDGSGRDASNKISYLNLFKAGGLMSSGGSFDITMTENTVSISENITMSRSNAKIRSTAALTWSDSVDYYAANVSYLKTGSETESWDVTYSLGASAKYSEIESFEDFTYASVYSGTTSLLMTDSVISGNATTSANRIAIDSDSQYTSAGATVISANGIAINTNSSFVTIGGFTVTGATDISNSSQIKGLADITINNVATLEDHSSINADGLLTITGASTADILCSVFGGTFTFTGGVTVTNGSVKSV